LLDNCASLAILQLKAEFLYKLGFCAQKLFNYTYSDEQASTYNFSAASFPGDWRAVTYILFAYHWHCHAYPI